MCLDSVFDGVLSQCENFAKRCRGQSPCIWVCLDGLFDEEFSLHENFANVANFGVCRQCWISDYTGFSRIVGIKHML